MQKNGGRKYKNKTVSVIVPVYNVEYYLPVCLDSLLIQTYQNLEIILIDDASTDQSSEIIDRYAHQDDRIKVLHKSNGSVSSARNVGIELAMGEYIYFVDPDDYVMPEAIGQMRRQRRQIYVLLLSKLRR